MLSLFLGLAGSVCAVTHTNRPSQSYYGGVVSNLHWLTEAVDERLSLVALPVLGTNRGDLAVLDGRIMSVLPSTYLNQSLMTNGSFTGYLSAHPSVDSYPTWTITGLFSFAKIGYVTNGTPLWTNYVLGVEPARIVPQALVERRKATTNFSHVAYLAAMRWNSTMPSNCWEQFSGYFGVGSTDYYLLLGNGEVTTATGAQETNITYATWPNASQVGGGGLKTYAMVGHEGRTKLRFKIDSDKESGVPGTEEYSGVAQFYKIAPVACTTVRQDFGTGTMAISGDSVSWSCSLQKDGEGVVEYIVELNNSAGISNVGMGFVYR